MNQLRLLNSLLFVTLFALALQGCGWMNAGGSSGTDNPTLVAFQPNESLKPGDTLTLRVWEKEQNPILSPDPIYDTTVIVSSGDNQIWIDKNSIDLDSNQWNVEFVVGHQLDAGMESEDFGLDSVHQSFQPIKGTVLLSAGTVSNASSSAGSISSSSTTASMNSSSVTAGSSSGSWDSIPPPSDTLVFYANVETIFPTVWLTETEGDIQYFIVLGTSIVIPVQQGQPILQINFQLIEGSYVVAFADGNGQLLSHWPIKIVHLQAY